MASDVNVKANPEGDDGCYFLELGLGFPHPTPPTFITIAELKRLTFKPETEVFTSMFRYPSHDAYESPILASLALDFDSKDDLDLARQEALRTIDYFLSIGISQDAIKINFTGKKGFHIYINRRVFDARPHPQQEAVWRIFAKKLKRNLGLTTLDTAIYDRRRMLRLVNSYHAKSGLYAIPLEISELREFTVEQIRERAKQPRQFEYANTELIQPIPDTVKLYEEALSELEGLIEKWRTTEPVKKAGRRLETLPWWVKRRLEAPIEEGRRDTTIFQLAVALAMYGLSKENAMHTLVEYAGGCKPPFPTKEVHAKLESAYSGVEVGKYSVSPYSDAFIEFTIDVPRKDTYPIGQERFLEIAADPALLYEVNRLIGTYPVIGENENRLNIHLDFISGQTRYPQSTILDGSSASGKNTLVRANRRLIPEDWLYEFTISTPEAVKYIPENFKGTLVIYEIPGVQSNTGMLSLRAIGEGEAITTIIPVRDENGRMSVVQHRTNAKNFVTTTTQVAVEGELATRVKRISTDESEELTKKVVQRKVENGWMLPQLKGKVFPKEDDADITVDQYKAFLSRLDLQAHVLIKLPFQLEGLSRLDVRWRRDVDKIMNLTRIVALLHQQRRPSFRIDGESFIIAYPEDVAIAARILDVPFGETVSGLTKRLVSLLEYLGASNLTVDSTAKAVAEGMKLSTSYVRDCLEALEALGYCTSEKKEGKGNTNFYTLTSKTVETPKLSRILEIPVSFASAWQEELNSLKASIADNGGEVARWPEPEDTWLDPISGETKRLWEGSFSLKEPVSASIPEKVDSLASPNEETGSLQLKCSMCVKTSGEGKSSTSMAIPTVVSTIPENRVIPVNSGGARTRTHTRGIGESFGQVNGVRRF